MKILLTMNLPYTRAYGGANRSNRGLAEALAAEHHSLCVVVPALAAVSPITHQQLLEELAAEGIRVISNGEVDIFNLNGVEVHAVVEPSRLCGYLVEQIRKFEPDWTLVSSEDRSQGLLEAALKGHPSRVIYLAHTPQMFPFGPAGLYPGKRRTELIGQASAIMTISRFVADYIRQWTGFESFVHHPPHYGSGPFPHFGRVDNSYVLMMNACAVKGISIFLALARALPDIQFAALPGWGTTNAELTALSALPNVILLKNCKNLDDILRRTRALLMPSLWLEGFGMAVVDAMLRGIPVLASNHGGLVEAKLGTDYLLPVHPIECFEDHLDENLLPVPVVPKQDIGPWQNALSRLLSDRALYERHSAVARSAALRFVSGLSVQPFEDFLHRRATEPKDSRHQFLGSLKDAGTHATASDTGRLGETIADLTPEQQALLILRLRKKASIQAKGALTVPPIKPVSRDQNLPLSFAQQRLWFLDQLQPGNPTYNISAAFRLTGPLHIAALERSLNEIVRRHETLRTSFAMVEEQPIQVIAATLNVTLTVVDLQEFPGTKRDGRARQLATDEARRPFDLAQGPLMRSTLLRLGPHDHILLLKMHHVISDGWSMEVFFRELSTLYDAFSTGKSSPLGELRLHYADYAVWQRKWLEGKVLERQLGYWKKQLAGAPALELVTDRPRPAVQTFNGSRESVEFPKSLCDELKVLSRKQGVTLFMTLLAAFQTLLHRYTGQDDIVLGTPIAGRNQTEIEGLIGFFVNTLVLRTDLSGDPSFRELLGRVRKIALEAYAHQDLPFEKLVEELQPERNLSHSPLFQVMFVLQNASTSTPKLTELTAIPVQVNSETAKFDLTLSMFEEANSLRGSIEYKTELFDDTTITRMLGHFQTLLHGIVENPDQRLSDLPILTEDERQQLLVEWNDTGKDYPKDLCIHQLFEAQAERTPDAVAAVFEGQELTYRELNRRSNQLARYLRTLGVGPEVLVGICVERSLEMIIGLLGILKAGAAYVPLDSAYPKERLAFMLEDTQAPVLLTQQRLVKDLFEDGGSSIPDPQLKVVCLDTDWGIIAQQSDNNLVNKISTDNLAYVIYTSGSTGQPKGVAVPHRAVNRLVMNANYVNLEPTDVVAQVSNGSFDAATFEIWGALLHGAKLVLITTDVAISPKDFAEQIEQKKISVLFLTTALFNQMAREMPEVFKDMRHLLFGGETVDPRWVREALKHGPPQRLLHVYGPTETTTFASWYLVKSVPEEATTISIGRPIANTEIYLLDRYLQLVPIGVAGEICIGGDGLARGYLNQLELTAEKFIPNPFSDDRKARLYKTGDLARYLPDGNIEFLGRIDNQVKIRGFRVEPGEIESVLSQHPAVQQTVVLAREDIRGEKGLVAYVVPNQQSTPTINDLRTFLKQKLPDYMVPPAFVMLDSLPLTPNGKVDRRALPAPDQSRPELVNSFVAPRTSVEEALAEIWAEVLKLEKVGVHDNFFELGGHSLLATQVISRLRESYLMDLPVRSLFENPTVANLAAKITEVQAEKVPSTRAGQVIRRLVNRDSVPASFAQQRLWFLHQLEPSSSAYNMLSAFRLKGHLNVAALEWSLNEISRRHEVLRTAFALVDSNLVQVIIEETSLELPIVDLSKASQSQREALAQRITAEHAQKPFNLAKGSLVRALLLRMSDEDHIFLYTMHHIVSDGWSMGIFYRELSALYEAFCSAKSSSLEKLPIQYADFAAWQKQWLQGGVLESQMAYWRQQLVNIPVLMLPTDRPRPPVQTYRGGKRSLALSKSSVDALKALSRREHVTLFMTLLAAFKALLHRYTQQEDTVVGSPIAGRNHAEIEKLIGFFVNTLVLRTDVSGNPTFRELLARVRRMSLDAYTHQDLPFEKLVEQLEPMRDLSRTPLFQVFFNMARLEVHELTLHGLAVEKLTFSEPESKFDFTLYVREKEQDIQFDLVYNADLFYPDTASRMLGHFQTLLEGIIANPEQRLSDLPLLTKPELHQTLMEWNDTKKGYPEDKRIHELFEAQVERTPDAVAVVFGAKKLTYRELNQQTNRLAHYLRKLGVGPEVPVGVCMERSLEMVVSLLGILKAGGAYVPLDPEYPKARLAYMLTQARIEFLLTKEQLLEILPEFKGQALCLDRDRKLVEGEQEENPDITSEPDNLVYVIYTSGSTGKPKGVLGYHRGVVNYLSYLHETYKLTGTDIILQLPSLSFDASVRDLIGPLTAGARVIIVNDFDAKQPDALLSKIREHGVTCILSVVPTLVNGLLEAGGNENGPYDSIRLILVSGEALNLNTCQKAKELFGPKALLVNQYGPTECTMTSSYHPVVEVENDRGIVPLGKPIPNARMYILDRHLNLMPTGIPGELCIGGVGLTRGYMSSPDLTAEKFTADPFSDEPGARLYKSGDLARYMPDGNIEFLGRVDHQVKIRGFRIELGEVEAVLTEHPAVQQAVAVAREDVPGDNRLIAYIVPNKDQASTVNDLRNFLKSKLPEYMVPSAFVVLDAFPLTPNRKVDRRALPTPEPSGVKLTSTCVEPRNPVEKRLADIWAEVLKLEQIGIHDDFFELGGHSLLATQVISRVREALQLEVPLRALFENPTVASLAVKITELLQAKKIVPEEVADVLANLESFSDEEAQRLLAQESTKGT